MKKIDEHHIALALFWLAAGLVLGILANISPMPYLAAAGAQALSLAFPVTAFAGLIYRFFPLMKQSKLAKPQFAMLEAGLLLIVAGSAVQASGGLSDMQDFGSVIALGGVVVLALIWLRERAPQA